MQGFFQYTQEILTHELGTLTILTNISNLKVYLEPCLSAFRDEILSMKWDLSI